MQTIENTSLSHTSIQSSDYRDLPLAQLVESPTNPRKRYDEANLQELAESIRAQGVLAPLLVRELEPERLKLWRAHAASAPHAWRAQPMCQCGWFAWTTPTPSSLR